MATDIAGANTPSPEREHFVPEDNEENHNIEEGEEDVTFRRNSQLIRQNRTSVKKERTPTSVVSEVFAFLSSTPSTNFEDMQEEDVDDLGANGGQLYSNLDADENLLSGKEASSAVHNGGLYLDDEKDKFLSAFQSKDSGFASLERQIGDEGHPAMYESFMENDSDSDHTSEMVPGAGNYQNVASNGAGDGSIVYTEGDDVYDDVSVAAVSSRNNSVGNPPCSDDEDNNAIASAADNFGAVNKSCDADSVTEVSKATDAASSNGCQIAAAPKAVTVINISSNKKSGEAAKHSNTSDSQSPTSSDDSSEQKVTVSTGNTTEPRGKQLGMKATLVSVGETKEGATVFDKVMTVDFSNPRPANVLNKSGSSDSGVKNEHELSKNDGGNEKEDGRLLVEREDSRTGNSILSGGMYENVVPTTSTTVASSDDDCDDVDDTETDNVPSSAEAATASDQAYDTIEVDKGNGDVEKEKSQGSDDGSSDVSQSNAVKNTNISEKQNASEEPVESGTGDAGPEFTQGDTDAGKPKSEEGSAPTMRRPKLEKNPSAEVASDESSDEDVGIYAESFRRSNWIRVSKEGKLELTVPTARQSSGSSVGSSQSVNSTSALNNAAGSTNESIDEDGSFSPRVPDDVFMDPLSQAAAKAKLLHKRSDSMTTTASEMEFKNEYITRRKCLIQRADSQQEYHRLSCRVYDQDKQVVVERISGCEDLGLHLLDSHPAFITSVDSGSAADKAGITEGQILVSVNDHNVLTTDHADIVELIQKQKGSVKLGVANSDFQPVRDLQATVMSGYMYKLGNSSIMKIWKKRFFVLRQDNCLYYYKNEQEHDPLGALPLCGYTISRHTDTSKDYCFKADKYKARTYYFMTDNRDQMTDWVGALTEAAARSKKRKESFLSVSSHNVGLPALDIRKPECAGFLGKLSPTNRSWRRRYCVLKDACIYYYKDVNSLNALGVAHLHGYTVDVENYSRKKFSFSLQPPEKRLRTFCFCADNETDKKRWVESLIHSIQRWVRVDKEAEC